MREAIRANFTSAAISGILTGGVARRNNREIAEANAGIKLPDAAILVVHRSEGSGTTFILADFLAKTDPGWKNVMSSSPVSIFIRKLLTK